MDTLSVCTKNNQDLEAMESDDFVVTKITIEYRGVGLGRDAVRVLEFPKLLWRKIYSIFTTHATDDNHRYHTISIEGLSNITKSQVKMVARELRKQMDEYAGFQTPAEKGDYDHTFWVRIWYVDNSTSILLNDTVTNWVTDNRDIALKTWNEWVQLDAIYSTGNLLLQIPSEIEGS